MGEILVRGPNVIRRYLAPSDANLDAFIAGWLRTGDLGSVDDEGYLTLTGRLKDVIIRGGEKISPREIDAVLEDHPAVQEAVAFGVDHPALTQDVVAAVVLRDDAALTEDELRQFAAGQLARYKVPRRILLVDAIPMSAGGKVQRNELAEAFEMTWQSYEPPASLSAQRRDTPTSPVEAALAGVWAQALERAAVGVDDDFFELGGDSLTGAWLLSMVEEVFDVEISPITMYDTTNTVAKMALLIEELRARRPSER